MKNPAYLLNSSSGSVRTVEDEQGKMVQLDGLHTQHQTVHEILYEPV